MAALIKKLLEIAWYQLEHCNALLQVGQVAEVATESLFINTKINRELEIGPSNLPLQMSFLFCSTSFEDLMGNSLIDQYNWLT